MLLTPSQEKIAISRKRFRVVNCGRRFGKTTLAVLEMVAKAVSKTDIRIAYIAPTYQQARDIAWEDLKNLVLPAAAKINESRLEVLVKTQDEGISKISLRGWESIETLRGQKFDFIVIDEIASMRNFWINWEEVIRPTLTDKKGHVLFISTPKGFNHFYDLYNKSLKDDDYESFHFTSYDNPHLPVEELDKAKFEMLPERFSQEYMADFKKAEGLVYKEFNRAQHVYTDRQEELNITEDIAGIDFGFTNPAAVIKIRKGHDNSYWVSEEWYKRQQSEDAIADYVSACKFNKVFPDPESPSAIAALRAKGVNVRDVLKNKDSITSGINVVRELFLNNRLKVHSSCISLIEELESYSYPEKRDGFNEEEKPIKENDHALDALRYALSMDVPSSNRPKAQQYINSNLRRTHYQIPR
jgi:PBSX family phage terminase large subunit